MAFDFGAKVSQVGKDVKLAGDAELSFSSSWPSLGVIRHGFMPAGGFPSGGTSQSATIKHGLDYVPAALVFNVSGSSYLVKGEVNVLTDSKELSLVATFEGQTWGERTYYYYILAINIESNYAAPITDIGSSPTGRGGDYGLKVSIDNEGVQESDFRNFKLHSSTRTPMIHMIRWGRTTYYNDGIGSYYRSPSIVYGLPYRPMYLAYTKQTSGKYRLAGDGFTVADLLVGRVTGGTGFLGVEYLQADVGTYGREYSLVIFKDPFTVGEMETIKT